MSTDFKDIISFVKALHGGQEVALHEPCFRGNEKKFIEDCIDSGYVSSIGEYVNRFEDELTLFTQSASTCALVNGTSALQTALRVVGVSEHEEVLTQALTFVATANSISYNNATPVFLDVDLDSMGLSPLSLKEFLESNCEIRDNGCYNLTTQKRIGACVPVHTFGYACRIDEIVSICDQWKIPVVEDAAEALGSSYKKKSLGTFGRLGCFSFNGNKIITAGGGGAVVSDSKDDIKRTKHLSTTAKVPHRWEYQHDELGYNFRMPNINAALACAQLGQLDSYIKNKGDLYSEYQDFFSGQNVRLRSIPKNCDWNYWLMSVELADKTERDEFLLETNNNGVTTRPIWKLIYKLPMYNNCQRDDQINSQFLEDRIVNIPSSVRPSLL